ncbi:homocysteine S-methyltransferase isoform X2 [Cottoperca gobio]|uniref:Homocysteine S-methyltransferase isoform X2 n=1 Tax=Cottoperca gobio TaxID=56716 RepID=A0A6J2PK33_COTGO|nr:homocysteine S-methyltransferase-like isoform X2 [Cottoperca gobio]
MGSSARLRPYMNDNGPLILDGGLATELEAQGFKLQGDPLWSARLLHTDPQAIREAHYRFLLSGADVITTATYQASISGFIKHLDVSSERARELLMSGVHLAKESVDRFVSDTRPAGPRRPLVAGSVGPYGAFLLDGSEYTGDYAAEMSVEGFKVWHRPQIECLAAAGVDLVAFETIPSLKEAQALLELLREFPNTNAWLSFSCRRLTSCPRPASGWAADIRRRCVQRRGADCEQIHAAGCRRGELLLPGAAGAAAGLCRIPAHRRQLGGVPQQWRGLGL